MGYCFKHPELIHTSLTGFDWAVSNCILYLSKYNSSHKKTNLKQSHRSFFILSSLLILKECKYDVQQRHSIKQWRVSEQKRWSCWRGGGLCTKRSGLALRVIQRSSNEPSASATARCLPWICLLLLRAGTVWTEGGKSNLIGWCKDDLDNFVP